MADTSTHASTERTAGEVWVPPRPSTLELAAGAWSGGLAAAGAPVLTPAIVRLLAPLNRGGEEHLVAGTGDEGWFGPHSVAWKVHSDIAMLVAGIGAFMLQTLHPRAMAGVFDHSSFGGDFFGRTRRTGEFVQGVVYGTSEEAQAWCDTVLAVHERVVGSTPDGRAYAANEPELLHWVHCTEYLAIAAANRRFAANPMSRRDLDTYVGETARVGEAMGVENPPRSWAEMHAAIEGHRPNLAVGEQAALGLGFLEHPPFLPPAARPVWRLLWSGAVAVQPPVSKLLLRLEEPAERDVAGCRALVRAMGRVLGEPPSYARARQRATGRQPTA